MKFKKDDLQKNAWVGVRTVFFNLPFRKTGRNSVFTMKNDAEFYNLLLENPNVHNVEFFSNNASYEITFILCSDTNLELEKFVAKCAAKCEFN